MPGRVVTAIVCDVENTGYWKRMAKEIRKAIGPVQIVQDVEVLYNKVRKKVDLFVIDDTGTSNMVRLFKVIQMLHPGSKILVASLAPTWKPVREAFYLGAADYIRKTYDPQEMISAIREGPE